MIHAKCKKGDVVSSLQKGLMTHRHMQVLADARCRHRLAGRAFLSHSLFEVGNETPPGLCVLVVCGVRCVPTLRVAGCGLQRRFAGLQGG